MLRYQLTMLNAKCRNLNVCVAYSRKVAAENVTLKERLDVAEARYDDQEQQIRALRVQVETMLARLDRHGAWITEKTKGK